MLSCVQECVVLLCKTSSCGGKLCLASTQPDKYRVLEFSTNPSLLVDMQQHSWGNYVQAAYKVLAQVLFALLKCLGKQMNE